MSQTIEAIFDGLVFRPLEPVELAPNSRVRITIVDCSLSLESLAALFASRTEVHQSGEEENLERYIYENYVCAQFNKE